MPSYWMRSYKVPMWSVPDGMAIYGGWHLGKPFAALNAEGLINIDRKVR